MKVLVCAFNKRIQQELERKLNDTSHAWHGMTPSEEQATIALWFQTAAPGANLVVSALAGTGKTKTITEAIKGIPGYEAEAKTLHSLGYMFVKGAWGDMTVDGAVEDDRLEVACQQLDGSLPGWEVLVGLKKLVSIAKGVCPDVARPEWAPNAAIEKLVDLCVAFGCDPDHGDPSWMAKRALQAMKVALTPDPQGRISFDDMLFLPVALGFTMPLYDWVIVDEAQDMNMAQLYIARAACKPGGHMVIVGDSHQAIYAFRGADSDALPRMQRELDADQLSLTTTYRCPKKVVELAQSIVADYKHAPWAQDGELDELVFDKLIEHAIPGDVVLSRVNAPLVPLCLSFIRRGVAARIEGRDIGKLLAGRAKKLKAQSVEDFLQKLQKWATTATSRTIARGKAVDARLLQIRDVEATLAAMAEDAVTVQDIYDRCQSMFNDVAGGDEARAMVVLSTVHKAKGLEWRRVFVLDDTFYCYGKKIGDREESNIHYVALTRSMAHLTVVHGSHAGSF